MNTRKIYCNEYISVICLLYKNPHTKFWCPVVDTTGHIDRHWICRLFFFKEKDNSESELVTKVRGKVLT